MGVPKHLVCARGKRASGSKLARVIGEVGGRCSTKSSPSPMDTFFGVRARSPGTSAASAGYNAASSTRRGVGNQGKVQRKRRRALLRAFHLRPGLLAPHAAITAQLQLPSEKVSGHKTLFCDFVILSTLRAPDARVAPRTRTVNRRIPWRRLRQEISVRGRPFG